MTRLAILCLGLLPFTSSYNLLPSYHQVPLVPRPLLYLVPHHPFLLQPAVEPVVSTLDSTLVYSARPNLHGRANFLEDVPDSSRAANTLNGFPTRGNLGPRNIDLCYFLGNDIFTSHVRCNPNWADGTNDGVLRYINEMTFETNRMLGLDNFKLLWKGPFARSDSSHLTEPDAVQVTRNDVLSVADKGCDAAVFLLFNQYSADCNTSTSGHKFGGKSFGGMCEIIPSQRGFTGYTEVVDQGFLDDVWIGPQIFAHHLLLMLTSDLNDRSKKCDCNMATCGQDCCKDSLLHPTLRPGKQGVDYCAVDKLDRSGVSRRACMDN
jgi:hypothetical protein